MTTPSDPAAAGRDHVLIVEDSLTQAVQLRFVLEEHGFAIRHARHGAEALAFLAADPLPFAVVSDVNMPGMDGYELCRRLRTEPRLAGLAVILLTSLSDTSDVLRALECGAAGVEVIRDTSLSSGGIVAGIGKADDIARRPAAPGE